MMDEVKVVKSYKITVVDEKQVPEFLEKIHFCLKKDTEEEEFGADWFLDYYVHGFPAQDVTENLNNKNVRIYSISTYIDKFRRYLMKNYLSNAAILALKNEYYPEAIQHYHNQSIDLQLGEKHIDVKLRRSGNTLHLENMMGKYVRDLCDNKQSVELVVIRFGIMQCSIETYKVECV